jgi:hypothetical protein
MKMPMSTRVEFPLCGMQSLPKISANAHGSKTTQPNLARALESVKSLSDKKLPDNAEPSLDARAVAR